MPYLEPVWHNAHWQVWRYSGYHGLVGGPARLESVAADRFTLRVSAPGTLTVRIHYSPHWAVDGSGCVANGPGGWIQLHDVEAGELEVSQALRGTPCARGT